MMIPQEEGEGSPWVLPRRYDEMTPVEKAKTLRSSILRFLQANGPATKKIIMMEIQADGNKYESVSKALDFLASTRQIYSESYGSRDTIYFPNGRLAHPILQSDVRCGRTEYAIRTYDDRLTGRNLTITEYGISISGDRKARGGIRIDQIDLDVLISELQRIRSILSDGTDAMSRESVIAR